MRGKHLRIYIIVGLLWLRPLLAVAEPEPSPPPEPSTLLDEEILAVETYVEDTRKTLTTRVLRLAGTIDTLFGDKRADDQNNTSTLRVSQRYFHKDKITGGEDVSVTLNLHLPNLQKIEENIKKKFMPKPSEEGAGAGGASATPGEQAVSPWDFNQESGIVIANPINYFARLRLRRDFLSEKFVHSFYEQVGWSKTSEWEEETSFNSDYALTRSLLFRFANLKTWAMTDNILRSSHGPSFLQQISERAAISYDLRFNTLVEDHALYGDSIKLGSLYRTRLPVGWIFLDLNPEIAWERATNFRVQYNFYMRIELVFGNLKK